MNPDQNGSGNRIVGIVLLIAIGAGLWWAIGGPDEDLSPRGAMAVLVVVTKVEKRDVPHQTSAVGTVQSLHSVVIRSQVEGILKEVLFQEGQMVKENDLIARIDDRAIMAALEQARAEKARNEAQLKAGEIDLARYRQLVEKKTIPAQTLDQQVALVDQLRAAIEASEAAIDAAEVQLSYTRITSPVSGRAGIRRVDAGNLVRASDNEGLVTVTQFDPIAVVFSLPQSLLPQVQALLDQATPATVVAFDRDGGTVLAQGRLVLMDNQIDARTGTIGLKAGFPNAEGRLWPGQFVTVQLYTGVSAGVLTVSSSAVQRGRDSLYVYRLDGDKVDAVPVILSFEDEDIAVVESGLALGDIVVSEGQSRLKPGDTVRVTGVSPVQSAAAQR
ncbi:MAG: efflux RND transporter periplasmic adaptor subunit [Gammaproteobacteria bacterium]|nr:efflux RND transporter periplasmic adaptor subunit [Gammaproteobacteria bacterium]